MQVIFRALINNELFLYNEAINAVWWWTAMYSVSVSIILWECQLHIKARFPLPELTARVDGLSTRLVETRTRQHGPCWLVMETGHPSTRAVNSGSGNQAWYNNERMNDAVSQLTIKHCAAFCQFVDDLTIISVTMNWVSIVIFCV